MSIDNNSVILMDFYPWNTWVAVELNNLIEDDYFDYGDCYEKDLTTGKIYVHQDNTTLRMKSAGLLVWTVAAHICNAMKRIIGMLTLYFFCNGKCGDKDKFSISERFILMGKDCLKLVITPAVVLSLEIAALYGLIFPREGRKEYASIERFAHVKLGIRGLDLFGRKDPYCAPCYQPGFGSVFLNSTSTEACSNSNSV